MQFAISASAQRAPDFDEMSLDRWAKLREVERYQLNVADKLYGKKEWGAAMTEYEKYLKLYERSEAAPYAQMRWSICLVELRKQNSAIKDGFQSVIDYWPDSPEAMKSAYFIARTYRDMGQVSNAKKAYAKVLERYKDEYVAVRAKVDLLELARKQEDEERVVALLKDLTFETKRTRESSHHCVEAARELASRHFHANEYDEAVKALETTYKDAELTRWIYSLTGGPIGRMVREEKTKKVGLALADRVIKLIEAEIPAALVTDEDKNRARQLNYWIAGVHSDAGRDTDVIRIFQQMKKTFGADDDLRGRFAQWYLNRGRKADAIREYEEFDDFIAGQSSIAWIYRHDGKHDAAIAIYETLEIKDDKDPGRWRWQIAECYESSGRFREAIGSYRVTENYPSNLFRMAACHRRLKEYNEALSLYGQIVTAYPDSGAAARFEMGETYEQADKTELAIRSYQQVCRDYPKSGHASRAHAHLQNKYKISVTLGGAKDE